MHKNAKKCNETLNKWCKNKHGASKIIDTFETLPLLIKARFFRICRRRRRSRTASSRETLESSPSWPSSASGASEVAETGSAWIGPSSRRGGRETKNWWPYTRVSRKTVRKAATKNKKANKWEVDEWKSTYRRQGMSGVEEISCQCWNLIILCKSSQSSHSFVEILFIYVLFGHSRRILRARVWPQLGNTMLKRLNAPLQKERHELRPRQRTSSCTLQTLDVSQQGLDIFNFSFRGRSDTSPTYL
jgi:hypothetical protein